MTIQEIQKEIVEEFSFIEDWQERYEHLIAIGRELKPLPPTEKEETNLVKGCQSNVWLTAHKENGKVIFGADSDAILPKGIAGLLVRVYSGQKAEDIITSNEDFIKEIGLQEFLSPTRANGLLAMLKQIKFYAIAFNAQA